jgi:hypothetical protein
MNSRTPQANAVEMDLLEACFHRHSVENYASRGHSYRDVAPSYHFGYGLAMDMRYQGRVWEEVRAEAEKRWNKYGVNFFWESAEPAIAYAWRMTREEQWGRRLQLH